MLGTIDIEARPIRIAYLVDPNNGSQVREAIRLSSTLWGGIYFPIIPMYKHTPKTWRGGPLRVPQAKSVILGLIEAFDPDVFVRFSKELPAYISDLGLEVVDPKTIWQSLDEGSSFTPKYGVGIFEILNDVFNEYFKYKAKYPPRIILPKVPTQLSLFWASLFGEIPSKLFPILEKEYVEPLEMKVLDFHTDMLLDITAGDVLFPRRLVQHKLRNFNRDRFGRDANIFFLDATKVDDIVDLWNLRALGRRVIPVPKQLKEDSKIKELVVDFLKKERRPWPHNPKVCDSASMIRSRNCTMAEMQEYARAIKIDRAPEDPSDSPFFSLQHWYPRIWDEWARDKDGAEPSGIYGVDKDSVELVETDTLEFRLKAVIPSFAQKDVYHGEPYCANELAFRFYGTKEFLAEVLPKSSGEHLRTAISSLISFHKNWRVGKNGLVRLVDHDFAETREIPVAEKIAIAWLSDHGWRAELSPPGVLAKQIFRRLEGVSGILRNEKLLGLLEYMNGGSVRQDGRPLEKNRIAQERELPVGEVKNRLVAASRNDNLHDYLISKKVFKLGVRIQCPNCTRNSWFPLQDMGDSFNCPKCQEVFSAIGNLDKAVWCYKTTGPFSVPNYADGAYSVLLTLEAFREHNLPTMLATPLLSFKAESLGGKSIEADFVLLWAESPYGEYKDGVMFGECKSYGKFEDKDFRRMRLLAKNFPGAVLVFSTLRKTLTKRELSEITRVARAGRKYWKAERPINPVLILTGNELLNHPGPPYCWDEDTRKKSGYMRGLLGLCNATQQIYLKLPSWETEWQEKWDKKRERSNKGDAGPIQQQTIAQRN